MPQPEPPLLPWAALPPSPSPSPSLLFRWCSVAYCGVRGVGRRSCVFCLPWFSSPRYQLGGMQRWWVLVTLLGLAARCGGLQGPGLLSPEAFTSLVGYGWTDKQAARIGRRFLGDSGGAEIQPGDVLDFTSSLEARGLDKWQVLHIGSEHSWKFVQDQIALVSGFGPLSWCWHRKFPCTCGARKTESVLGPASGGDATSAVLGLLPRDELVALDTEKSPYRIGLVREDGSLLLEALVLRQEEVQRGRRAQRQTRIAPQDLVGCPKAPVQEVVRLIDELILSNGCILVGHTLGADMEPFYGRAWRDRFDGQILDVASAPTGRPELRPRTSLKSRVDEVRACGSGSDVLPTLQAKGLRHCPVEDALGALQVARCWLQSGVCTLPQERGEGAGGAH
uniref:Uncharacterized protein n=1 Tax=Rhizochromulina marina TaxID=1034831 RepID=A0A7S2SRD9_9STRA